MPNRTKVFIVSAPSGAGKSSLIRLLLERVPSLSFSVSHTTRPPRGGEKEGVDYFFVDRKTFETMIREDQFLEWALVHERYYGTSKAMLEQAEKLGKDLLLDVDYQGAQQVRKIIPEATSIFILPPSQQALYDRLVSRKQDTPDQISQRMVNARDEIPHYKEYDFVIINDDLTAALDKLTGIIRSRSFIHDAQQERIAAILKSFNVPG
jgi:guanylate kinase